MNEEYAAVMFEVMVSSGIDRVSVVDDKVEL
jgi:hypothetical protein